MYKIGILKALFVVFGKGVRPNPCQKGFNLDWIVSSIHIWEVDTRLRHIFYINEQKGNVPSETTCLMKCLSIVRLSLSGHVLLLRPS